MSYIKIREILYGRGLCTGGSLDEVLSVFYYKNTICTFLYIVTITNSVKLDWQTVTILPS